MPEIKKKLFEGKSAAFSLKDFRIIEAELKLSKVEEENEVPLYVKFNPSGIYNSKEGVFDLAFETLVTRDVEYKNVIARAMTIGEFKFESLLTIEELPSYFYGNSIAILFPFVRAYLATISTQGNNNTIMLPVLNLSDLEKPLRENTKVI